MQQSPTPSGFCRGGDMACTRIPRDNARASSSIDIFDIRRQVKYHLGAWGYPWTSAWCTNPACCARQAFGANRGVLHLDKSGLPLAAFSSVTRDEPGGDQVAH